MGPDRTELLADIDAWLASAAALGSTLASNWEQVDKGREMVAQGMRLSDAIGTLATTTRYLRMKQALADFELARFRLRSSLISAALAEGLTEHQLVDLLGVPPELTSQVLDELGRPDRPTGD